MHPNNEKARETATAIIAAALKHADKGDTVKARLCVESAQTFIDLPNPAYGAARSRGLSSLMYSVGADHIAYKLAAALPWPY